MLEKRCCRICGIVEGTPTQNFLHIGVDTRDTVGHSGALAE